MQVDNDMIATGQTDYFNPNFRYTLEAHIPYLLSLASTTSVTVNPHDTTVYNQDFFGYLLSLNILPCYHWITMRVNGMFSPTEFNSDINSIFIPSTKELESLRQSWNAIGIINT